MSRTRSLYFVSSDCTGAHRLIHAENALAGGSRLARELRSVAVPDLPRLSKAEFDHRLSRTPESQGPSQNSQRLYLGESLTRLRYPKTPPRPCVTVGKDLQRRVTETQTQIPSRTRQVGHCAD